MLNCTLIAYVFAPIETIEKNGKTFHVLKVKYLPGKDQKPVFVEAYISDGQFKYASLAKAGDMIVLIGELSISAYTGKDGQPKSKISLFARSQKIISKEPKQETKEDIPW